MGPSGPCDDKASCESMNCGNSKWVCEAPPAGSSYCHDGDSLGTKETCQVGMVRNCTGCTQGSGCSESCFDQGISADGKAVDDWVYYHVWADKCPVQQFDFCEPLGVGSSGAQPKHCGPGTGWNWTTSQCKVSYTDVILSCVKGEGGLTFGCSVYGANKCSDDGNGTNTGGYNGFYGGSYGSGTTTGSGSYGGTTGGYYGSGTTAGSSSYNYGSSSYYYGSSSYNNGAYDDRRRYYYGSSSYPSSYGSSSYNSYGSNSYYYGSSSYPSSYGSSSYRI